MTGEFRLLKNGLSGSMRERSMIQVAGNLVTDRWSAGFACPPEWLLGFAGSVALFPDCCPCSHEAGRHLELCLRHANDISITLRPSL